MAGKLPGKALDPTTTITINNISFGDNVAVNSSVIVLGNSTVNTVINSIAVVTPSVNVGSNVFVNTSTIHLGNSTVNTVIHTTGFTGNGAGLHGINASSIATGILDTARLPSTVNISSAINVGANLNINTSTIFIGNSTVNTTIIAGNVNLQGTELRVGNVVVNGNQLSVGNVTITDAQISVGNSTVNTVLGSTGSLSGNGSQLSSVNAIALQGNSVSDILTSANTAANTLAAAAFSNAASRADSAYSNAVAYANLTFLPLAGGTLTGALTINATANVVSNLSANNVTFRGNVQIDGNLVVSGTSVTLNVATLAVEDNMIHLNNGSTDTHPDLGVAGNYNDGTYKHAGIFRDATDGVWKVFDGYTPEPNTAFIDTSNASFRIAHFTANVITANGFTGNGASITSINASSIASGTLDTARLPATVNVSTALNVGANVNLSTTDISIGNVVVNSSLTSTSFTVGGNTLTVGTTAYYTSNGFIGLGTPSPNAVIEAVSPATSRIAAGQYSFVFRGENNNERLAVRSSADAVLIAQKFNGTYDSPTAVTSGQNLGGFQAGGYTGTGWTRGIQIRGLAAGNWSSTDTPADITFQTVPVGSTSLTDRMTIGANGNVGIGTASPATRFHVYASGGGLELNPAANTTLEFIDRANTNATVNTLLYTRNGFFAFYTGGYTERLRILNNGKVGIGTDTPSDILTVDSTTADSYIRMNSSNVGNTGIKISYSNSSTHGMDIFYYPNNAQCYFDSKYQVNAGTVYGDIYFRQNVAGTMTTRMTIKGDGGNVGIGTTSPAGLWSGDERALHIAGTGTTAAGVRLSANSTAEFFASGGSNVWGMYSSSDSPFVVYTNGTEKFRIGSEGGMGLNMGVTFNNNFIINGYTTVARMYSGADAVFGHNVYGDASSRVLKQVNSSYYASWIRMYYNKGIHFGTSNVVGTAGDTVSDPAGTTNDKMILDIDGRLMLNTSTANTTANTILTVKGFTSNTSNFMIEGRDSSGVLRTAITDRGAQNWYIQAGDGLEKGSIRYSTPGGFVGILYYDSAGTSRSDFRHVANGGFTWHAHALGTVPPELMRLDNAGNLTIVGTLTESSSITLKENLDPIQDALGAITSLTGYVYDRKDGTAKRRAGLIAEEVESILPNVVKKDGHGNPTGIQYTNLIAYLVESIKELKAEIDILKSR